MSLVRRLVPALAKPLISAMLNDITESNRIHAATTMPGGGSTCHCC